MTRRKFDECAVIQKKINWLIQKMPKQPSAIESALGLRVNTGGAQGEDPYDLSYLANLYPSIPLNEYVDDGDFHHINKKFPGLRAIHKDPWIFLVPNLLSPEQCRALMIKGGKYFTHSTTTLKGDKGESKVHGESRSSWDVRIPFDEVPKTQNLFSEVLDIGVEQMEPLKLIRYEKGQFFLPHHDEGGGGHLARRIITMFVYLNTCESGGETNFPACGVKVRPRTGLGVIHFPSHLATAGDLYPSDFVVGAKVMSNKRRYGTVKSVHEDEVGVQIDSSGVVVERAKSDLVVLPSMRGRRDERVKHEGVKTHEEKFIASQWCFEGDVGQDKSLKNYGAVPLNGDIL
jgi:prolyl 4-hydroxylase